MKGKDGAATELHGVRKKQGKHVNFVLPNMKVGRMVGEQKDDFDLLPEDFGEEQRASIGEAPAELGLYVAFFPGQKRKMVPADAKVGELKTELARGWDCSVEPEVHFLSGSDANTSASSPQCVLKDNMTLVEQGVTEGSTIAVVWPQEDEDVEDEDVEDAKMEEAEEQEAVHDQPEQDKNCETPEDGGDTRPYSPEIFTPNIAVQAIRSRWMEDEVWALARGIEQYGVGEWRAIQASFPVLRSRSAIQLKDKWRNIQRVINGEVNARTQHFQPELKKKLHQLCDTSGCS